MVPMLLKVRVIQRQVVMAVLDNLRRVGRPKAHRRHNPRGRQGRQNDESRNCPEYRHHQPDSGVPAWPRDHSSRPTRGVNSGLEAIVAVAIISLLYRFEERCHDPRRPIV